MLFRINFDFLPYLLTKGTLEGLITLGSKNLNLLLLHATEVIVYQPFQVIPSHFNKILYVDKSCYYEPFRMYIHMYIHGYGRR